VALSHATTLHLVATGAKGIPSSSKAANASANEAGASISYFSAYSCNAAQTSTYCMSVKLPETPVPLEQFYHNSYTSWLDFLDQSFSRI